MAFLHSYVKLPEGITNKIKLINRYNSFIIESQWHIPMDLSWSLFNLEYASRRVEALGLASYAKVCAIYGLINHPRCLGDGTRCIHESSRREQIATQQRQPKDTPGVWDKWFRPSANHTKLRFQPHWARFGNVRYLLQRMRALKYRNLPSGVVAPAAWDMLPSSWCKCTTCPPWIPWNGRGSKCRECSSNPWDFQPGIFHLNITNYIHVPWIEYKSLLLWILINGLTKKGKS